MEQTTNQSKYEDYINRLELILDDLDECLDSGEPLDRERKLYQLAKVDVLKVLIAEAKANNESKQFEITVNYG